MEEAQRIVAPFVEHYNAVRLHSAIGYIMPNDYRAGHAQAIWAERGRKLEVAREQRRLRRQAAPDRGCRRMTLLSLPVWF